MLVGALASTMACCLVGVVLSLCDNDDISMIAVRKLIHDDKCVQCAETGVNHKNVPAQQISNVKCDTLASPSCS